MQNVTQSALETANFDIFAVAAKAGPSVPAQQAEVVARLMLAFNTEDETQIKAWLDKQGPIDQLEVVEIVGRGPTDYVYASNLDGTQKIAVFKESLQMIEAYFQNAAASMA